MTEEILEHSEHTRKALITKNMGFNQMRNGIYWLQRIMKRFDIADEDIHTRMKEMGSNIGATFAMNYTPNSEDLSELIKELYKTTLNSKISVNQIDNRFYVEDRKCALCKYKYDDVDVPGCNITVAMIHEMLARFGYEIISSEVNESRALGNKSCIHEFQVNSNFNSEEVSHG
ncbi:MAG: hypothetical protein E4G98_04170 [Promethearchaeota archaeon]|nr:MAG: hypothetical protein E4G98_04170 [Candidatus Lokiarchaeota archaeon]